MAPMLPASCTGSLHRLLVLGLSAGALLGGVALIPGRALAVPIGPLDKSNNESVPHRSYQESRIGVETNEDKTSDIHPVFLIGGLICCIDENLDPDLGLKCGLNEAETDRAVLAGLAMRF